MIQVMVLDMQSALNKIAKYFKEGIPKIISTETETANYVLLRSTQFSNYLFKGPVLEWYMKVKLKLENNYAIFQ
jgi:hypothetical protein